MELVKCLSESDCVKVFLYPTPFNLILSFLLPFGCFVILSLNIPGVRFFLEDEHRGFLTHFVELIVCIMVFLLGFYGMNFVSVGGESAI